MTRNPDSSAQCGGCGLVLFGNIATAVGAFIADEQGRVLLLRRGNEPSKGKLGAPGGFIDIGETVEEALRREVREEVNLEVETLTYLCSFPNRYEYKGITYPTADLYFICTVKSLQPLAAMDEVESCCFLAPEEIDLTELAFPTLRQAFQVYLKTIRERQ